MSGIMKGGAAPPEVRAPAGRLDSAVNIQLLPDLREKGPGTGHDEYVVIVYDNPVNTYAEVIQILQAATGCSRREAEIETWEIDHLGQSVVHHGSEEECERAASIIRTIGIQVEVRPEWGEG